ncbi:hypothetical protein ABPG72_019998 [Tetrahymena utriculariae]
MIPEKPLEHYLFNESWKFKYPWINCKYVYDATLNKRNETIYCTYCIEQFEFLILKEHLLMKIQFHFHAESHKFGQSKIDKLSKKQKDGFNQLFGNQKLKISDQLLSPLFQQSYFIAKEDLPLLKYENLKILCKNLEVDEYISIDSYQVVYKKREIVTITARYIDFNYQVKEEYLTIKQLDECDSQGYLNLLIANLKEYNLLRNIIILNTDGCPVVSSLNNELAGKLKQQIPYILCTQCIVYNISLGVKEMAKRFQYVKNMNYYVYTVAGFLNTRKRLNMLFESEIQNVRWISYFPSIQRLITLSTPVLKTLYEINDEDSTPNLTCLIDYFENFENILLLATYGDILNPFYTLTKQLQKEEINLMTIESDLSICLEKLDILKENDGELVSSFYQRIDISYDNDLILDDVVTLKQNKDLFLILEDIDLKKLETIDFLIKNLQERLQFGQEIKHFQAFNIKTIRQQKQIQLDQFGIQEIKSLLEFYKINNHHIISNFNEGQLIDQYKLSKQRIFQYQLTEEKKILQMITESKFLKEEAHFYKLFYIISLNTVECERIFSKVIDILVKKRNKLSIENIDMLIFVSRHGPSIDNLKQLNITKAI